MSKKAGDSSLSANDSLTSASGLKGSTSNRKNEQSHTGAKGPLRSVPPVSGVWFFPLTYMVHLMEEYFVAGGFPLWAERALAVRFGDAQFLAWNAFAFALMCVGAVLVGRDARFRFIEIALAIAVLGNVVAHVAASLVTWTYSPGLISGLGVWVPLGMLRLQRAYRATTRRARRAGTCLGMGVVLVALAVLLLGTMFGR